MLVAALAASGVAVRQQRQAVHQRRLGQSAQFAAQSDTDLTASLLTSDLEALAAWQGDHSERARSSLLSRQADPYLGSFPEPAHDHCSAIAISPDGKVMAVAEEPGFDSAKAVIQLWDIADRRLLKTLWPGGGVRTLDFSPDGGTLAASVVNGVSSLQLWDMATYRSLPDPFDENGAIVTAVSYSAVGNLIAIATFPVNHETRRHDLETRPTTIDVWDTVTDRRVHRSGGLHGEFTSLSFSPDGSMVAAGGYSDRAWLWDLNARGVNEHSLFKGTAESPEAQSSVLFSPDGRHIAISVDNEVLLDSLSASDIPATSESVAFRSAVATAPGIAFGPEGRYLYSSTGVGGALGSYDVATNARISPDYELPAFPGILAAGGTVLIGGFEGDLFAFDLGQRALIRVHGLNAVAVARSGRWIATGGFDSTIEVWRPGDPAKPQLLPGEVRYPVDGIAFSSDRRLLAAIFRDCNVRIWHLGTAHAPEVLPGDQVSPLPNTVLDRVAFIPGTHSVVTDCSYASQGRSVVQVNALLVRGSAGSPKAPVPLPKAAAYSGFAVSPDGSTLAISTGTGTVSVLKTGSHRVVAQVTGQGSGPMALAFSPDGALLATANSTDPAGDIRLWNAKTGAPVRPIGQGTSGVRDLAFSPGGHLLATASQDGTVRLWSPATGQLVASLAAFPSVLGAQTTQTIINQVAFLPGDRLVAADDNGNATVWDLNPAREVDHLCSILGPASIAKWWHQQNPSPGPFPCIGKTGPGDGRPATAAIPAP